MTADQLALDAGQWVWPLIRGPQQIGHPFREPRPSFGANHLHEGVDLALGPGRQVVAVAQGNVTRIHLWNAPIKSGMDAYGNHVAVLHPDDGTTTWYCHLAGFAAGLKVGDQVLAGQVLGLGDSTGNSTADHLHFMQTDPVHGLQGFVFRSVVDPTDRLVHALVLHEPVAGGPLPTGAATNQAVINVLYAVAPTIGLLGSALVSRLGWEDVYEDRRAAFDLQRALPAGSPGPLEPAAWLRVAAALATLVPKPGGRPAVTTLKEGST